MSDTKTTVLELDELQQKLGLKGFLGHGVARVIYNLLELKEVNRIHSKY